jgi:hypothetical protein
MTIYCLNLVQGGLAIFCQTMGAEATWKLLLVFEFGSFWQFFRIYSLSPLMTPHASFDGWWVPMLDKSIYNVLLQNLLFLTSKKIHNIWRLEE